MLWSSIPKRRGHKKINECVKIALYNWIIQHPQVFQHSIYNDCLKFYIDGQEEPQLVPKLLLKVLVRELHNTMEITPEEGVPKEERDA